jgi:dTDP-glucose 4,6-dehydratase
MEVEKQRLRPKNSEVFRLLSNNSLASETIDWQPKVSFDQGLELTIAWIKQHLDLYNIGKYEF